MNLSINLDDGWIDDYEDHIADLIKSEIGACIKAEVRKVIQQVAKENLDGLRDRLAKQMRELTPKAMDEYLTRIAREGI